MLIGQIWKHLIRILPFFYDPSSWLENKFSHSGCTAENLQLKNHCSHFCNYLQLWQTTEPFCQYHLLPFLHCIEPKLGSSVLITNIVKKFHRWQSADLWHWQSISIVICWLVYYIPPTISNNLTVCMTLFSELILLWAMGLIWRSLIVKKFVNNQLCSYS